METLRFAFVVILACVFTITVFVTVEAETVKDECHCYLKQDDGSLTDSGEYEFKSDKRKRKPKPKRQKRYYSTKQRRAPKPTKSDMCGKVAEIVQVYRNLMNRFNESIEVNKGLAAACTMILADTVLPKKSFDIDYEIQRKRAKSWSDYETLNDLQSLHSIVTKNMDACNAQSLNIIISTAMSKSNAEAKQYVSSNITSRCIAPLENARNTYCY